MPCKLSLSDEDDGIEIAKSGAPEPSAEIGAWLTRECKGRWRYETDTTFNVVFHFGSDDDARRFQARWNARTVKT